ncbi:SIMPL domain-containing protein [Conchiformibius kuhniae]|uniref:SIMPL domain-containing protein n=1 Tax=Conchiformibius kuhniae TaxID=211502 RepID=A0A8T9MV98_9NEIS|nr:SIMPL domain-containing protein [Conchiformibius kuhniae]UOP05111.1 SIMPL domain-containing protein [Conchiformibius kuhniae]
MKTVLILAALLTAAPAFAADTLHYNIVNFSESVSVSVPHDTLSVTLNITEKHKDRQRAAQTVTRRLNTVLARIKANRRFESETVQRRSSPEYDNGKMTGWRDRATVVVKSTDFVALMRLVADSEAEAALDGMNYSVSPEARAAAVEKAGQKVLQTVRERAQSISRSQGFSGYKIVKMNVNRSFENFDDRPGYRIPAALMYGASTKYAAEAMDDNPGKEQVRQSIDVSIQMH